MFLPYSDLAMNMIAVYQQQSRRAKWLLRIERALADLTVKEIELVEADIQMRWSSMHGAAGKLIHATSSSAALARETLN